MSDLADLIGARGRLVALKEQLASCETALVDNELRTRNATVRLQEVVEGANDPDSAGMRAYRRRELEVLPEARRQLEEQRHALVEAIDALSPDVDALESSEPALWDSAGTPVVLVPVRIETCFKRAASGWDLLIRIYPDDLHLDSAPGPLTEREYEAGQAYWNTVWPSIGDRDALTPAIPRAWETLARQVDPARMAFVADQTRPENAPEDLTTPAVDTAPRFPPRRAAAGTGTRAALMPDAWTVYALRDGELLFGATGKPIPADLPVSAMRSEPGDDGQREWLVDFSTAVDVGMALTVHLDESEPSIDQLFVLGVAGETDVAATGARVSAALASHARRGALEFIPPRAPTNNTTDSPSAWHSEMPPAISPDAQRIGFDPAGPRNAASVARALGVDGSNVLAGIPGAADDWQTSSGIMIDALFPGLTVDWDMLRRRDMNFEHEAIFPMAPFDEANYNALRTDAAAFVRGRGPLPALRIRRQPYGLLPISSLDAWIPAADDAAETIKLRVLRHIRPFWLAATGALPRAGSGKDQDEELAGVLSQDSVSTALVWREAVGTDTIQPTTDPGAPLTIVPDIPPTMTLLCQNVDANPLPYNVELVSNPAATVDYWKIRREIVERCIASPPMDGDTIEFKVQTHLGMHPGSNPPLTKSLLYALFSYGHLREGHEGIPPDGIADLDGFWRPRAERQVRTLTALETVPAEELSLLTAETVDLFSHRLDAWITSLATRRLRDLRAAQPRGCHIGGFGWVESLKPAPSAPPMPSPPPGFTDVIVREDDTYVLAPSLHHAASAAVLRAGFDSHTDAQAFGVNLKSGRSRRARWIVDGVRAGQSLGALLGYWIERELHEAEKDEIVDDVRAAFPAPIVPDPDNPEAAADALEAIAARNVVDGLALHKAVTGTGDVPATPVQSAALAALAAAAPKIVPGLADLVDAVGDLVLAESVHQLVAGNPMRAGLAADTLGRGESLPSRFDVITSPRSGVGLTCSVAVLLPMTGSADDSGWSRSRPRARLAPQAEAWTELLLGPRSAWQIACSVGGRGEQTCGLDEIDLCALDVVFELDAREAGGAGALERRILAQVRTREGVDSAALATGARAAQWVLLSGIAKRIMGVLAATQPLQGLHLDPLGRYQDPMPGAAEFDARVTAASASDTAAMDALVAAARALADASPDDRTARAADVAIAAAVELAVRAERFFASLSDATTDLANALQTLTDASSPDARLAAARNVGAALTRMADHGIDSSVPLATLTSPDDAQWIAEQARLVLERLTRMERPARIEMRDGMSVRGWTERASQILTNIAGPRFPIMLGFAALPDGELAAGLARPGNIAGADLPGMMTWLRRLGRVRPPVGDFHDLMLTLELREDAHPLSLKVIQAPSTGDGDTWAVDARPESAQRTALLQLPAAIPADSPVCGWLIDAWAERIPGLTSFSGSDVSSRTELAGLTFHYNQPDARAPHAILIAVPPDPSKPWTAEMLLHVLRETFDLARIRSVEHRDLPRRTPIVPMTYVLHSGLWPQEMDPAFLG
jgi:hypothetical protein